MLTIRRENQSEVIMQSLDDLVPEKSLLRKIDKCIDFTFIYDEVQELYCLENGRPSIDPVVLFKLVFLQAIKGIKSMRETCERVKVDAEYRWFLGIPFSESTPHFSTFSKNYARRYVGSGIFEKIFINIVNQAISKGLVSGDTFFTDSTHKKANANKRKFETEVIEVAKKRKLKLEYEINEERVKNGRKPFEFKDKIETKKVKVNKTDPESGYYHRSNKENGFMYLDHRTVDGKCNIIVDCYITKGNVHDSVPYINRMKHIEETFGFKIKQVALDSGYDSIDIKRFLDEKNILGALGDRRYGSKESRKYKKKFDYYSDLDIYVYRPTGDVLEYTGLIDRNGYKKYQDISREFQILRHIREDLTEKFKTFKKTEEGMELYRRRKETVERSFADSKQNHAYRYAMHRGLDKNQDYTWLICAAQNMKNIALKVS